MGKGSKPRPMSISYKQWEENWDRIFGKKKEPKKQLGFDYETVTAIKNAPTLDEAVTLAERDLQIRGELAPSKSFLRGAVRSIQEAFSKDANNSETIDRAWMNYQI